MTWICLIVSLWCLLICSYIKGGFLKRLEILQHVCQPMGKIWSLRGMHIVDFGTFSIVGPEYVHWEILRGKGYFIDIFFQKVTLKSILCVIVV